MERMSEQKSFKERVKDEIISCAFMYKNYFIDYEYLVCSKSFSKAPYYIIQSHEDNYIHLTGVSSTINATSFFYKSLDGTLSESDFSFVKRKQTEIEVKGSVRRKFNSLPQIMNIFDCNTLVEENFEKNSIRCSFAVGKTECTLGFTNSFPSKSMSLLKGNQLDNNKSISMELVLRCDKGKTKFDKIIVGGEDELNRHYINVEDVISENLKIHKYSHVKNIK